MNILTQLHHGAVVNDELNIGDKIDTVYNQLNVVYSELFNIIDSIKYSDDIDEDEYDDYDDYDDYHSYDENGDFIDNTGFYNYTYNELIDHIEDLKIRYLQLKEKYDSLNN